jgi:ribose 5-phosphate isomerase B
MIISLGADHAGFELKNCIAGHLKDSGYLILDRGTATGARCDYPDFAAAVAHDVAKARASYGILVCGTGIGMCIAANKVRGVRAAHATSIEEVRLGRGHNDANILTLGARLPSEDPLSLVDAFLGTPFEGGRHATRVEMILALETKECRESAAESKSE